MKVSLKPTSIKHITPLLGSSSSYIFDKLLSGIKIIRNINTNQLLFMSTDLGRFIVLPVEIEEAFDDEPVEMIVPGEKFCNLINSFPGATNITLMAKGNSLEISQGRIKHKISVFERKEVERFPDLMNYIPADDEMSWSINKNALLNLLSKALVFIDKRKAVSSSILSTVGIKIDRSFLMAYASDGSASFVGSARLDELIEVLEEEALEETTRLSAPAFALPVVEATLLKAFLSRPTSEEMVQIVSTSKGMLSFELDRAFYVSPVANGIYPMQTFDDVLRFAAASEAKGNAILFLRATLDGVLKAARGHFSGEGGGLIFSVSPEGLLDIQATSEEGGDFSTSIDLIENGFSTEKRFILGYKYLSRLAPELEGQIAKIVEINLFQGRAFVIFTTDRPFEKIIITEIRKRGE